MKINKEIWQKTYSGIIHDVMEFDIKYKKPYILDNKKYNFLTGTKQFGFAFTCQGDRVYKKEEIKDHIRIEMMKEVKEDSFQIIANGYDDVAIMGDITCLLFAQKGCKGTIIDGYTRDLDIIEKDLPDFCVFGKGVMPVDAYGKWQIIDFNIPVTIDGIDGSIEIFPDDLVFCDKTSAMIIPKEIISEVESYMAPRILLEEKVRMRVKKGDDLTTIYKEEGRW